MKKLLLLFLLAPFWLTAQNDAYKSLQRSLRAFSPNTSLTVFRGMDYNWAGVNFQMYLQMDLGLASKTSKNTETKITLTYVPEVTKNNELLKVIYYTELRKDIVGAYGDYDVQVIKSVAMTGPSDLMATIFLKYWPGKPTVGDITGQGAVAYKELLGDYITLHKVDNNTLKIEVSKGNMDVDYASTYGINQPK